MSTTAVRSDVATTDGRVGQVDMKLEVVVLPVSDVGRAAEFYGRLGWRKDADIANGDRRILQFTPSGSACSIIFGTGLTPSAPGTVQYLHLIVSDIEAARDELARKGAAPSEVFHDAAGGYNRFDPKVRASGPDPRRRTYASFVTFSDPDGNGWVLQEITTRFPGRVAGDTTYASVSDLAQALRRAEAAHGEHEKRTGQRDANWPDWYAAYLVAEQAGTELPT
ncbi:MAG TPA: VOC family protein [Gemmatimonadota bacterium]|jgi:catechol 2,3-dioxygenase-like lactoylglutathione lyase family enzyme